MTTHPQFRKVFQEAATRQQMFQLFDRHGQAPMSKARYTGRLYDGEWFEIRQAENDYMFEILPPLWMRGEMFAMREFMAGSVTSVFYAIPIRGRVRYFHGYCDMLVKGSAERMRDVIIEREARPVPTITRAEQLDHVWSATRVDYRGYAGERWPERHRGKPTILVNVGAGGTVLTLLENLSETEIATRLARLSTPVAA
ncbi:MAG: hypothetical protein JWQ22_923 [Devosia sp.]|nr:hypothetical protein [Devosia sp.]